VAQELRQAGWPNARALMGGWEAWQAEGLPVEPKPDPSHLETSSDER
jgi:3-mercaptopyruvate sulfurtransferase SseA